jgi:hypothetical protein
MVSVSRENGIRVSAPGYSLRFRPDRPYALLTDADGVPWADLLLTSSLHTSAGLDDTAGWSDPVVETDADGVTIAIAARSSVWASRRTVVRCRDDVLALRVEVTGDGDLTDAYLLGGYSSAQPRRGTGWFASGAAFRSLVNPGPSSPDGLALSAGEAASVDVVGGSQPGRGNWFFTPPPLCFVASRAAVDGPGLPVGPWLTFGIAAEPGEQQYTGFHYEPGERTFALRLAYEGQTSVRGAFATPWLCFTFGAPDPYAGIASYVAAAGLLPRPRHAAAWWREPIFCGWGAQSHLALATGAHPADFATQDRYDAFLAELAAHDVDPGTIVIDDKWERTYGSGEADPARWPDLRGWIDGRHAEGRRVLLWWKAWDPEALPPELCVRNAAGVAVTADPSNPEYVAGLEAAIGRMLSSDGYDADGLKIDFTAMTPSGPGMTRCGPEWGAELLHRLMQAVHRAAKATKPDALVMTHTPNPSFADVTDMIRLNDVQRLDDPSPGADFVAHMVHRARIVRATLPDVLIDTDNWAMPDVATWRRYLAVQGELGIPSLYYTTHIDRSGEALREEDYAALRGAWAAYRASLG